MLRSIWKKAPDEDDFRAVYSCLCLLMPPAKARAMVKELRVAKRSVFQVKDLLRAADEIDCRVADLR
jgi:hypothetical protein